MRNPFHKHESVSEKNDGWTTTQTCSCEAFRHRSQYINVDSDWSDWFDRTAFLKNTVGLEDGRGRFWKTHS